MSEDHISSRDHAHAVSGVREPLPFGASHDGWAVGTGSMIQVTSNEYGGYTGGYQTTPHGIVGIYTQTADPPHTSFDFVHAGRVHRVAWMRTFSDRFLKTLAKRFAASVVEGAVR